MRAHSRTVHSVIRPVQEPREKKFGNGDCYVGGWLNGAPEGQGRYQWADSSVYDGEWRVRPPCLQAAHACCASRGKLAVLEGQLRSGGPCRCRCRCRAAWGTPVPWHSAAGASVRSAAELSALPGWLAAPTQEGRKHGRGTYAWPNGAKYTGDWSDGCMHGVGCFVAADGSRYDGSWCRDLKQGLGRKQYANGDVYEGMWLSGKPEGPGRYVWQTGPEYDGEWMAGKMHGKGTFKWVSGERYDGEWVLGHEEGVGVFTWRDGATYEGFWKQGKKHGFGVMRPAPPPATKAARRAARAGDSDDGPESPPGPRHPSQPATPVVVDAGSPTADGGMGGGMPNKLGSVASALSEAPLGAPEPDMQVDEPDASTGGAQQPSAPAGGGVAAAADAKPPARPSAVASEVCFVREYCAGAMVSEVKLTVEEEEALFGPLRERNARRKAQRQASRRRSNKRLMERAGEKIYKGHRSYDLMLALQLGVRYSLQGGGAAAAAAAAGGSNGALLGDGGADIGEEAFAAKVKQSFPHDGSSATPPHPADDFSFTDYCPSVFKKLRQVFQIDSSQYLRSLCGDQALRELSSPGKSGSVFFISHDDLFLAKTVRREEMKLLMDLLPRYYQHVSTYRNTLLVKFFGLHKVKPANGRRVRFIIMNNVFRTDLPIHRKYDLKGSTHGRSAGPAPKPSAILKDLDLQHCFKLEEVWHERLQLQLQADVALLEQLRVMDYSLLLGVHYLGEPGGSSTLLTDREGGYTETEDEVGAGGLSVQTHSRQPSWDLAVTPAAGPGGAPPASPRNGQHLGGEATAVNGGSSAAAAPPRVGVGAGVEEVAAWLRDEFGKELSPGMLSALMQLSSYRIIGAPTSATAHLRRSTTMVLARRPQRSATMRPHGHGKGGTDDLSAALGYSAVRLGTSMVASAQLLPSAGASGGNASTAGGPPVVEDVVLYFGIIDILQEFNARKKLESSLRRTMRSAAEISAVGPGRYAKRFVDFMHKVFT